MFAVVKSLGLLLKPARISALALAFACLFTVTAEAAQYTFPGNLPLGCIDNTGGNYACSALTLSPGDRVSVGTPQPATITFDGALTVASDVLVNTGPNVAALVLVINGALTLGGSSALNATVQTLGAGAVSIGANSEITGAVFAQNGNVTLAAPSKVGGSISTGTGLVAIGAGSVVGGGVSTVTGYVTVGTAAAVGGPVTTEKAGYVVLGASAQIIGNINVQGEGYVSLGDAARAGANINTVNDSVTLGANSQVVGSVITSQTGAVTLGANAVVGGNIITQVGDVTVGAGGKLDGTIAVDVSGNITIGASSKIYAVCCYRLDASCVTNSSGIEPAPLVCPVAAAANFECLQTGVAHNNVVASASSRNPLYTKLAGTAFTLDLIALRTDGTIATSYAGAASRNVRLELVNGEGSDACSRRAVLEPDASQTLTFGIADAGRKTATVTSRQSHANLRCRVTDFNQSPSIVGCSTDNFSVRPSAVVLQAAAVTTAAAPSAISLPAIAAGKNFSLRALTLAGTNYMGQLRLDTEKLTAQLPSQDNTIQAGGTVGLLQPSILSTNAAAQVLGNYGEVGYLYLAPGTYRDDVFTAVDSIKGDCITGTANNENLADTLINGKYGCSVGNQTALTWGRFYPDHLSVTPIALTAACTSSVPYTYFAEDGLTTQFALTARNTVGVTTKNYSGLFAKLNLQNYLAYGFSATPLSVGSVLASSSTVPIGQWLNGTAQVTAKHQISRPSAPQPQTLISVSAAPFDSEIPAGAAVQIGDATRLRYGRLQLKNVYGSELLALAVPLEAQYWTPGGYYITNADDSCTVVSPKTVVMRNYTKQLKACETQIFPITPVRLLSGRLPGAGLVLSKPGVGNEGSVDLSINLGSSGYGKNCTSISESPADAARQPWFGSDPSARMTFGIYKSRKIYSRENY